MVFIKAVLATTLLVTLISIGGFTAFASGINGFFYGPRTFRATLNGFEQVPTLYSNGTGMFTAALISNGTILTYKLSFAGMTNVTAASIGFGEPGVAGGVIAYLCGGGHELACPTSPGSVSGNITAANVVGPTSQGVAAGNFAALVAALRNGAAFVNIQTKAYPSGEIRGQIGSG
jgi:hypothetical protein